MGHSHHEKILLVMEHAGVRKELFRALAHCGMEVLMARSAERALALLRIYNDEIAVAILDASAGKNGLDLAADCGREFPSLPILFVADEKRTVATESIRRASPEALLPLRCNPRTLASRVNSAAQARG